MTPDQHYLNEFDPFAAEWLRGLMLDGQIPAATVDERSIKDVKATDLIGYKQCHFFAGIGGWPLAFKIARIEHLRSVWSGSCPCQPFSPAGKGKGQDDPRHLWPVWFPLIRECQPEYVFGEQVSAAIGHGWLDGVFADMEGAGYTGGAVVLGAHSVGAPHIRQRVFWGFKRNGGVSDANVRGHNGRKDSSESIRANGIAAYCGLSDAPSCGHGHTEGPTVGETGREFQWGPRSELHRELQDGPEGFTDDLRLLNANGDRCESRQSPAATNGHGNPADATGSGIRNSPSDDEQRTRQFGSIIGGEAGGSGSRLQHAESNGRDARRSESSGGSIAGGCGETFRISDSSSGRRWSQGHEEQQSAGADWNGPWSEYTIGTFRDGNSRRIGRGVQCLAHGIPYRKSDPRMGYLISRLCGMGHSAKTARAILKRAAANRTGRLKGYGNAIVPQIAAVFLTAFMESFE